MPLTEPCSFLGQPQSARLPKWMKLCRLSTLRLITLFSNLLSKGSDAIQRPEKRKADPSFIPVIHANEGVAVGYKVHISGYKRLIHAQANNIE